MRGGRSTTYAEVVIVAGALVGAAGLACLAVLAVQRPPVPLAGWVVAGTVTAIGFALTILAAGRHTQSAGTLRHSSGEFVVLEEYRRRRRRGTRIALDWKYSARGYALPPLAILLIFSSGSDLLAQDQWWQQTAGALLVVAAVVATGALVRWLLLPVDPDSQARRDAYYEDMRWDWGAVRRWARSLKKGRSD